MAQAYGLDQLVMKQGDDALSGGNLPKATACYISAERSKISDDAVPLNNGRLGLTLIARIDEDLSFMKRAPDVASEQRSRRAAVINQRRAMAAFTKSLKHDKTSQNSALSYFGTAECLTEEAMQEEALSALDGVDRSAKIERLRRNARRRYGTSYMRDKRVNIKFDQKLPFHLDNEGQRTLPVVHSRYLERNQKEADILAVEIFEKAQRDSDAEAETRNPLEVDRWSSQVDPAPPPAAAGGGWDESGDRAEAELRHFKREHDERMKAAYSAEELRRARLMVHRGLKDVKKGH